MWLNTNTKDIAVLLNETISRTVFSRKTASILTKYKKIHVISPAVTLSVSMSNYRDSSQTS